MSTTELADRLDRCANLIRLANGALEPELLECTADELRQHQCAGERESVNAELLAVLKGLEWICGLCPHCGRKGREGHSRSCSIANAIARAEAADKAPAQPDAVDGLVEALRKIKRHGVGIYGNDESLYGMKKIATDALAAYEQKEKA